MLFISRYNIIVITTIITLLLWKFCIYSKIEDLINFYTTKVNFFHLKSKKIKSNNLNSTENAYLNNYMIEQISVPINWTLNCINKNKLKLIDVKTENIKQNKNLLFNVVFMKFHFKSSFMKFIGFCNCISQAPYLLEIQSCNIKTIRNNLLDIVCIIKFLVVNKNYE